MPRHLARARARARARSAPSPRGLGASCPFKKSKIKSFCEFCARSRDTSAFFPLSKSSTFAQTTPNYCKRRAKNAGFCRRRVLILISLNHYVLVDLAAVKKADPILHIKNKIASGEPLGNFVIKTKLPKGLA